MLRLGQRQQPAVWDQGCAWEMGEVSPSPAEEFQTCWEKQPPRPPPAAPGACTALHWSSQVQTGCNPSATWAAGRLQGHGDGEMGTWGMRTWGHADRGARLPHRREDPPLQPCSCHLPSPCPKCNHTALDNQWESGGVGISPAYPSPAAQHCCHRCHQPPLFRASVPSPLCACG